MAGAAISVFSVKGGGGASLIAANLAVSLRRETRASVALLDVSYPIPGSIALYLGLSQAKAVTDIVPLLDRMQPTLLKSYVTSHASGIAVIPAAKDSLHEKMLTPQKLARVTDLLVRAYDYVVIDLASTLSEDVVPILDLSELVCLVLSPDVGSVAQGRQSVTYLQSHHFSRDAMRLVLNRYSNKMPFPPETIEENVGLPIALYLPLDEELMEQSIAMADPFVSSSPRHPVSKALDAFTQQLVAELQSRPRRAKQPRLVADAAPAPEAVPETKERTDEIRDVKIRIHRRLIDEIDFKKADIELAKDRKKKSELRAKTEVKIVSLLDEEAKGMTDRDLRKRLVKEILDEALGLGPLEDLLRDPDVSEIMVNGIDHVFVERKGKLTLTEHKFLTEDQLRAVIERIVNPLGRRIDEKSPMVDARLEDGSRVNAIIPPLAIDGPSVTIRKFAKTPLKVPDLVRFGSFTTQMAQFFEAAVLARQNIVISGGTGSGKTTLLNVLSSFVPEDERIVTIEDSAELQLPQEHVVRLESRPPNIEGEGAVTIRDLVRNALRMRPDRIVVGECRAGEALDMLQAMNTGHDGSLTTVHANTPRDALSRLETLCLMAGLDLPARAIREQIASAIDLVFQQSRLSDGTRRVTHVAEITGREGEVFTLADIFLFKQTGITPEGKVQGQFAPTGVIPKFIEGLSRRGIKVPREIFLHQTA
ncbi:MAG TPA: ATPase, T2SS/T4P/T4SS family [Vicinamibacteria bacterium]|nr:ATPase, T2SS/T4P/T4SS family [Vicinamibacteria bacterium]